MDRVSERERERGRERDEGETRAYKRMIFIFGLWAVVVVVVAPARLTCATCLRAKHPPPIAPGSAQVSLRVAEQEEPSVAFLALL